MTTQAKINLADLNFSLNVQPYSETPSGVINSSNTIFTLAHTPAASAGVQVYLNGIVQYNGTDFSVSGNTITFVTAPITGSVIYATYNIQTATYNPTPAYSRRLGKSQMVATRTGLNGPGGYIHSSGAGYASRTRHCLPFGAKYLQYVWAGFFGYAGGSSEIALPTGGGLIAISATTSGGTGYAVGDTITPTVAANQQAPVITVDAISGSTPSQVSVSSPGLFSAPPATGLTQNVTSGSGTGATVTFVTKSYNSVFQNGIEQVWNNQLALAPGFTIGILINTAQQGQSAPSLNSTTIVNTGANGNIALPAGQNTICDPLPVNLAAGSHIGTRLYTPGWGIPLGRGCQGSLNENAVSNTPLASSNPVYGGSYQNAIYCQAMQPAAIMGIPINGIPTPTFVSIGNSIANGYSSQLTIDGNAQALPGQAMDSNGNGGYLEQGINEQWPWTNFSLPGDRMYYWLSQGGAVFRQQLLTYINPSHVIDEMGINDVIGGESYSQFKAQKIAFWNFLRGCGPDYIWATTLTPNPTSTNGVAAVSSIASGGTGYATSSTFNVTVAGGTQSLGATVISVSTNSSGVVTTINSISNIGYYTVNPSSPNSPTGGTGSGLSLHLEFSKCLDLTSQSTNSNNTVIQAFNTDLRNGVYSSYIDKMIDLGTSAESTVGSGLWPAGGSGDALHPTAAQHAIIAAQITSQFASATL